MHMHVMHVWLSCNGEPCLANLLSPVSTQACRSLSCVTKSCSYTCMLCVKLVLSCVSLQVELREKHAPVRLELRHAPRRLLLRVFGLGL